MSASQQIVVGVDGSPSSIQAPEWAIGQAALIKTTLAAASIEAVIAWHTPHTYGAPLPDGEDCPGLAAEVDCPVVVIRDGAARP
jgi:nucleotide-binding universal stress UspA family protein